jgi:hypothetical protein
LKHILATIERIPLLEHTVATKETEVKVKNNNYLGSHYNDCGTVEFDTIVVFDISFK